MGKCLYCYRQLDNGEKDFHAKCAKKFFGTEKVPVLDYTCEDLERLAIQAIKVQTYLLVYNQNYLCILMSMMGARD